MLFMVMNWNGGQGPWNTCLQQIHKDSSQINLLVEIVKNMGIQQKHKNQGEWYSAFSNFIEGKLLHLTRHAFVMNSTVQ